LIDDPSFTASGRALAPQPELAKDRCPLIVAIHGGGFTHKYFDIPGYSLLERAAARGYGIIGIDRLGHGRSRATGKKAQTFANNRDWLSEAIDRLWPQYQDQCDGVVLIGHSIGAALAVMVAAAAQNWPLAGVAVSGAALAQNPALSSYFERFPADDWIETGAESKDRLMLGKPETFEPGVPELLHPAYRPVSTRELAEIYTVWLQSAPGLLKTIKVPVQFRLGEQDPLWVVNDEVVQELSGLLSGVAGSSAAIVKDAGHAIDFHKVGPRFHDDQLDFALACVRR
jgi:pimeloyl-ACP methyl ester carboxylesterase